MSWTPDFLITRTDFESLRTSLSKYNCFEFKIENSEYIILNAGETSQSHRELHEIIKDVKHYLVNGEGETCLNCVEWGEQIYEYEGEK